MKILAIETSCDETAASILEVDGHQDSISFSISADETFSQMEAHKKYGGVVPDIAKREHAKNLLPILSRILEKSQLLKDGVTESDTISQEHICELLKREGKLGPSLIAFVEKHEIPDIDLIAVTNGPGLEPALWVGLNFAKALALLWEKPLVGVNHMEGHILSVLIEKEGNAYKTREISYPALALLISGGHTELVVAEKPLHYQIIGGTRDDAVGEAFDKVARLLGLPYPGGPAISALAEKAPRKHIFNLPRPMLSSSDFDFSFSGLKTSVLYKVKALGELSEGQKADLAYEFEEAVKDVLVSKTLRAAERYGTKTLVIGGGVSANKTLREAFAKKIFESYPNMKLLIPDHDLSTDNAIMIGIAGFLRYKAGGAAKNPESLRAEGNLALA